MSSSTGPNPSAVGSSFRRIPSIPAINWAATARYGLQVASGGRNSNRELSGRLAYFGILIAAERLPSEKIAETGASYPGMRRR